MLAFNKIAPEKKNPENSQYGIRGHIFHLFHSNPQITYLYDNDLSTPIIWGSNSIVIGTLKNIYKFTKHITKDSIIIVYNYKFDELQGYRRFYTYKGPVSTVGKYIH